MRNKLINHLNNNKMKNLGNVTVAEMLQRLMDSEINFTIKSFYDEGLSVYLGDEMNADLKEVTPVTAFDTANVTFCMTTLAHEAVKRYPDSKFAKWYNALDVPTEVPQDDKGV